MAFVNIFDMADTWNDAGTVFTAIKMDVTNTASASGSKLLDLLAGGSSRFAVSADGALTVNTPDLADGDTLFDFQELGVSKFKGTVRDGFTFNMGSSRKLSIQQDGLEKSAIGNSAGAAVLRLNSIGYLSWNPNATLSGADDAFLNRDAAATLAQRNGVNAQQFNVYQTYTDSSNYERLALTARGLFLQRAGTGAPNIDMQLTPAGTGKLQFGTHTAIGAETLTGYIEIKDSGGTLRKVGIVS